MGRTIGKTVLLLAVLLALVSIWRGWQLAPTVEGAEPDATRSLLGAAGEPGDVRAPEGEETARRPASTNAGAPRAEGASDGLARAATASIRGTVRCTRETYHPEVIDKARARFDPGVEPPSEELDAAWAQLTREVLTRASDAAQDVEVLVAPVRVAQRGSAPARVRTDAAGGFVVEGLPEGDYEVRVAPPPGTPAFRGDDPRVHRGVSLRAGQVATADFELPLGAASLSGRVVDARGDAIADARVGVARIEEVLAAGSWNNWGESYGDVTRLQRQEVRTNVAGRFRVDGLQSASFSDALGAARGGQGLTRSMVALDVVAAGYVPLRLLALPLGEDVERAASGAWQRLLDWSVSLGDKGLEDVGSGPLYGGEPRPVFVDGAQVLTDLVLVRSASIAGTVADPDGHPLAQAELRLVPAGGHAPEPRWLVAAPVLPEWIATGTGGAFALEDLPAGSYTFEVRTAENGVQQATNAPLTIAEGARLRDVHVVVRADEKGALAGTAVDAQSGEPLPAFRVAVRTSQGWSSAEGSDGAFRVEKLQEGPIQVRVQAEGYATAELESDVRGGATTAISAALDPAGSLEGAVTLDGAPARGMLSLYVDDGSDTLAHSGWFDGRYRAEGLRASVPHRLVARVQLAPGSYVVARARALPGDPATVQDLALARPPETLRGTVRDDDEDSRWSVYAFEAGASAIDEPTLSPLLLAAADGRGSPGAFELGLPPGQCTLLLRVFRKDPAGGPPRHEDRWRNVVVQPGSSEPITLELD